jgi:hypothetical protein
MTGTDRTVHARGSAEGALGGPTHHVVGHAPRQLFHRQTRGWEGGRGDEMGLVQS